MTITARHAAKEICELGNWDVSNLRLQKIMYFAHMYSLVEYTEPLINETFRAWLYGPVIPEVYREVSEFGRNSIESAFEDVKRIRKDSREAKIIKEVFMCFSEDSTAQLVEYTHRKGGAWDKNYVRGASRVFWPNNPIPDAHIAEEYSDLMKG